MPFAAELNDKLEALRQRLAAAQIPQIAQSRRAIILFEGLPGSGKKQALRQLAAAFDPCHYIVHPVSFDRRAAPEGHWLARFWRQLPENGQTAIFFRSWYRRVLEDRALGRTGDEAAARAFDEINEFEAQQQDAGTAIVKLFFTVDPAVQRRRLAQRAAEPWAITARHEEVLMADHPAFARTLEDLRRHSDTRWSPWHFIDGSNENNASLSALTIIAEAWEAAIAGEPAPVAESRAA